MNMKQFPDSRRPIFHLPPVQLSLNSFLFASVICLLVSLSFLSLPTICRSSVQPGLPCLLIAHTRTALRPDFHPSQPPLYTYIASLLPHLTSPFAPWNLLEFQGGLGAGSKTLSQVGSGSPWGGNTWSLLKDSWRKWITKVLFNKCVKSSSCMFLFQMWVQRKMRFALMFTPRLPLLLIIS